MLKRRLKLLGKILLGFIVLLAAFLLFERVRGQTALAGYKKQLVAKSEKSSPQDFVPPFSDEDNGAPAAIAAIGRLTYGEILLRSYLPQRQVLASGRAIVGHREPEFVEREFSPESQSLGDLITNRWEQVAADLQKNAGTFAEIRQALAKPVLNNELDLADWENPKLERLSATKSGAQWFGAMIQNSLHQGDHEAALEALLTQLRLLDLLAADQTLIAELIRMAIGGMAQASTWELLQAEGWTDAALLQMHQAWDQRRFLLPLALSMKNEAVIYELWHHKMRNSNEDCFNAFYFQSVKRFDWEAGSWVPRSLTAKEQVEFFWKKRVYTRTWRFAWSHQTLSHGLTAIHALAEIGQNVATNQSNQMLEQSIATWTNQYCGGRFYDRLRRFDHNIEGLHKSLFRAMRGETDRSLTITAIALKRYALRHGEHPVSLDALVPDILPAIPIDYMDGKSIRYRLTADGSFTLYSVGADGQDDGGDLTLPEGSKTKDLWRRRDYVWPAPATPDEVEEYRRESAKN